MIIKFDTANGSQASKARATSLREKKKKTQPCLPATPSHPVSWKKHCDKNLLPNCATH
jgi:hypothetical protein